MELRWTAIVYFVTLVVVCIEGERVSRAVYFPVIPDDFQDFGIRLDDALQTGRALKRQRQHPGAVPVPSVTSPRTTTTTDKLPIAQESHVAVEVTEAPGPSYLTDSVYYDASTKESVARNKGDDSDEVDDGGEKESVGIQNIQGLSVFESPSFGTRIEEAFFIPSRADVNIGTPSSPDALSKQSELVDVASAAVRFPVVTSLEEPPRSKPTTVPRKVKVLRKSPRTKKPLTTTPSPTTREPSIFDVINAAVFIRPNFDVIQGLGDHIPSPFFSLPVPELRISQPLARAKTTRAREEEKESKGHQQDEDFGKPSASVPKQQISAISGAPVLDSLVYKTSTKAYKAPSLSVVRDSAPPSTIFEKPDFVKLDSNIYIPQEYDASAIPGEPGLDYPVFHNIPETDFSCSAQEYFGLYADVSTKCQVFHICQEGGREDSFLCPNGTVFNQQYFVCDWWYNFACERAPTFYSLNQLIYEVPDSDKYLRR